MEKERDVAIWIKKVGDEVYTAKLVMPDMPAVKADWSTPEAMGKDKLARELESRGAHLVDVWDAFAEADRRTQKVSVGPETTRPS